jgi:hypothetical protein
VSPKAWKIFHAVLTVLWAVMMPVALLTGWVFSIAFISVISIYANFVGHFSSFQASRAEEVSE